MKLLINAFAVYLMLSVSVSKANGDSLNLMVTGHSIECSFDRINKVYLIKFNVSESGIVTINITDELQNENFTLAEGEMDKGEYTVYFKPSGKFINRKYTCNMKVCPSGSDDPVYVSSIDLK